MTGHEIIPAPGTVTRADGSPGSVLNPRDYPLNAICQACGQPVTCTRYLRAGWWHGTTESTTTMEGNQL